MQKKKIAVFYIDGNINHNPNLLEICNFLCENNYIIDLWTTHSSNLNNQIPKDTSINIFFVTDFSYSQIIVSNYCFTIGIDVGIIYASRLAQLLNINYGFISYEIVFDCEITSRKDKIEKKEAVLACKNISFAIVQDSLRGKFLVEEYKISEGKLFLMPVAGKGLVESNKSSFLHSHFNFSPKVKILLHVGSVNYWTMIPWVVSNLDSLPNDWVLVIHNRGNKNEEFEHPKLFYTNLKHLNKERILELIQSANACLGLYAKQEGSIYTGKNIQYIGLSSSKIANSLQFGVPVITNEIGEYSELIRKYDAGVVINTESNNPFSGIESLDNNEYFNEKTGLLFKKHLDFELFSKSLLSLLNLYIQETESISYNFKLNIGDNLIVENYFKVIPLKKRFYQLFRIIKASIMDILKFRDYD